MNINRQRSNSSADLRKQLQKNLVSLPEISDKVALVSYINYCKKLHESARKAYDQADMRRCYVDLYKFQILALNKIPTHRDYKAKSAQTIKAKTWLNKATVPAMDWLEIVVFYLDKEEDERIIHLKEFNLMDEFDAIPECTQPNKTLTGIEDSTCTPQPPVQSLSVLSMPSTTVENSKNIEIPGGLSYVVPDITYTEDSDEPEDIPVAVESVVAVMLRRIGSYKNFSIPQPSTTEIEVSVGERHYSFFQDDFLTSYAGFLTTLPPELQLSREATESNRCYFIHLGIALNIHPFALQSAFRSIAVAALETAEEWEKDILATVCQYSGFVDANMLCFLWPEELCAFRICFVSGPLTRPLISCFQPPMCPTSRPVEELTEIIIRCSGDHFTLLRPTPLLQQQLQQQQHHQSQQRQGFRVISRLVEDARVAKLVVQVSDAREAPAGSPPRTISSALAHLVNQ